MLTNVISSFCDLLIFAYFQLDGRGRIEYANEFDILTHTLRANTEASLYTKMTSMSGRDEHRILLPFSLSLEYAV